MFLEMVYAYVLGLLSILSPCTFIIVPVMTADITTKITRVLGFLAGITVTFGLMGIVSALTGKLLTNFLGPYLYLFAGVITLIAGLNMLGLIELRFPQLFTRIRAQNSVLMGILYGGVALSCIGPLLSAVLVYIVTKASLLSGFWIMYVFSLGFITPFLVCGFVLTDRRICQKLQEYTTTIQKIGGVMLLLASSYLLFVALRGIL